MTLEQIEEFSKQLAQLKHLMNQRNRLEDALKDGKRESIKIQSTHITCDSAVAIAMLTAGIDAFTKEIEAIDAYLTNLEVVPKAKTKKGGE